MKKQKAELKCVIHSYGSEGWGRGRGMGGGVGYKKLLNGLVEVTSNVIFYLSALLFRDERVYIFLNVILFPLQVKEREEERCLRSLVFQS